MKKSKYGMDTSTVDNHNQIILNIVWGSRGGFVWLTNVKYLLCGPLQKMFADPAL